MRNSKEDYYSVRKDGVLVFLEKKEMEEFIESVRELYKREDVQQDLLKEYVEVYGAV
jgi:CO dehydrogenase/acetyl-CoA synthase beta subunit